MKHIPKVPNKTTKLLLVYDIVCQWFIHQAKRFDQEALLEVRDDLDITPAVGKFHLGAHILECFWRYSLNFIKGAGQLDGEVLETLWAELDKIAGFVRGMSVAHRQEVIDDMMIDSNWKKLIGMPQFLTSKLERAQMGLEETKHTLDTLSRTVGERFVAKWTKVEMRAFEKGGIGAQIYEAVEMKGESCILFIIIYYHQHLTLFYITIIYYLLLPTFNIIINYYYLLLFLIIGTNLYLTGEGLAEVSLRLTKAELKKKGDLTGDINWILRGMMLEHTQ
jgi:hypothetical protein